MIGSFGSIVFSVSADRILSFSDMKRDSAARFSEHEVIGAKPKVEFLGPSLDSVSFNMVLSIFNGVKPLETISVLRSDCKKGTVHFLILGGKNMGKYILESVSEAYDVVTGKGGIASAKVDVKLKEYC